MSEQVKLGIELVGDYVQDGSVDFAVIKLQFLSDGFNTHALHIPTEVLERDASSILGKPIVAKYSQYSGDVEGHEQDEIPVGVIPSNAEIYFEDTDNGKFACVDGVIFKLYANEVYELYKTVNHRSVSVEMTLKHENEDPKLPVISLNIHGVTLLGLNYEPSCTLATSEITRFSKEANNFYDHKFKTCDFSLREYAERRKTQLADNEKTYKVDKSKESVSSTPWGDVDKTSMRNKIMEAKNRSTLVKDVYLKVESGWEDSPSENLKYPVMQLKGDTFVYNEGGLSSARGYGETNDQEVANKAIEIQKRLELYKEGGEKMAVEDKDKKELETTMASEDEKKDDAKLEDQSKMEDKKDDDSKDSEEDDKKDEDDKKQMSSDANVDAAAAQAMNEKEAEKNKALAEEMAAKDNIIMEQNAELEELRKFKADMLEDKKMAEAKETLAEVADNFSEKELEEFEEEVKNCNFSELDGWKNKVKAIAFESVKNDPIATKSLWTMGSGKESTESAESKGLWD